MEEEEEDNDLDDSQKMDEIIRYIRWVELTVRLSLNCHKMKGFGKPIVQSF